MDMFDFFFPEQAQAGHLRQISTKMSRRRYSSPPAPDTSGDVADLRSDVGFLTLVVTAILKRLAENETMSLADVSDLFDEIDGLDGLPDGGLNPGVLRGMLGVLKQEAPQQSESVEESVDIDAEPYVPIRFRRRRR